MAGVAGMVRSGMTTPRELAERWLTPEGSARREEVLALLRGGGPWRACVGSDDLRGIGLRGAELPGADLRGALLCGADLSGALLANANLIAADLSGAELAGCDLTGARLTGARGLPKRSPDPGSPALRFPSFHDAGGESLRLLQMADADTLVACECCVEASPAPYDEIVNLLAQHDWRWQLIGLGALLVTGLTVPLRRSLWTVADRSFVGVQGAVVAYLLDPDFRTATEERLRAAHKGAVPPGPYGSTVGALGALYAFLRPADPDLLAWVRSAGFPARLGRGGRSGQDQARGWLQRVTAFGKKDIKARWLRG